MVGDGGRRVVRSVRVGDGGSDLAGDDPEFAAELSGVGGAVDLRDSHLFQFQSAAEARWLLPAERLDGNSQSAAAKLGGGERAAAGDAMGSTLARARAEKWLSDHLRPGDVDLFGVHPGIDAVLAVSCAGAELGDHRCCSLASLAAR